MHPLAFLLLALLVACRTQPETAIAPRRLPPSWRTSDAHQRMVLSYLGVRYSITGDSLNVELCPAVAVAVDTVALGEMAARGTIAVRSVQAVSESRCSGPESRVRDDLTLVILSTRMTRDSFIVTAERRRPSAPPFSWREQWIELAEDIIPRGMLMMSRWSSIE